MHRAIRFPIDHGVLIDFKHISADRLYLEICGKYLHHLKELYFELVDVVCH
jgi:hypothetical protein